MDSKLENGVLQYLRFAGGLLILIFAAVAGCAENSLVLKDKVSKSQQQQTALARQKDEFATRATSLDRNNQELVARLTQERQQAKALEDQVAVLRGQLTETNAQLARIREEKRDSDQKAQILTASMQRQGGASITPNSSVLQNVPTFNIPDVVARRDGDVIRVAIYAQRLFEPTNAKLLADANKTILAVAAEVLRLYPNQLIGVEGHTDPDPIRNPQWRNNHELSIGRAYAVYDVLVAQARIPSNQLVLVGHGGNHPIYSNAAQGGKQYNNRVELVVYPDVVARR
jgi:chemotaxis protein MotB